MLTAKLNQPTLPRLAARAALDADRRFAGRERGRGHGRVETRTISVVSLDPLPRCSRRVLPVRRPGHQSRTPPPLSSRKWTTATVYAITSQLPSYLIWRLSPTQPDCHRTRSPTTRTTSASRPPAPTQCESRDQCFRMTRDVADQVRIMVGNLTDPVLLDSAAVQPWLDPPVRTDEETLGSTWT